MKKILVLAYAISPTKGSEYSVAWSYINNMSKDNELVVLYGMSGDHMGNIQEIEEYTQKKTLKNVRFIPVLPNKKAERLNWLNRHNVLVYTFYYAYTEWQKLAYLKAKEIIELENFDLIHYLGPIGYREPGYLWKLGLPYMWGPIGGTNNSQISLFPALSVKGLLKHSFRSFANTIQLNYNSRLKKALIHTDLLLTATTENQRKIEQTHKKKSLYLPENCIAGQGKEILQKYENIDMIHLIFIGRLDEGKALIILLESLNLVKNKEKIKLHVVGDGPSKNRLLNFAKKNNINNMINWHGKVKREEVFELLKLAHLHCITSISEANTTTIWEAMASGIPTLTVDHCGMHDVVCEKCGFKIPIDSYRSSIERIASTINNCIENPSILKEKAIGVLECAKKYTWEERRIFFNDCYEKTIRNHNQKKR